MSAELRRIEARCRAALQSLNLPGRFSTNELLDAISENTGREIVVRAADLSGSMPSGLLLKTASTYTILHARNVTPLHRDHIISHEGAHALMHFSAPDDEESGADHGLEGTIRRLMPDLHPDLEPRFRTRTNYGLTQELEAEKFATMAHARMVRIQLPAQRIDDEFPSGLRDLFEVQTRGSGSRP